MGLPTYGSGKRSMPVLDHRAVAQALHAQAPLAVGVTEDVLPQEMTTAERARTIVSNNRLAVLSVNVGDDRAPIGFVVPYAVTDDGIPFLGIRPNVAAMAQLQDGMQASLAVAETPLTGNTARATGGTTIVGILRAVKVASRAEAMKIYARTQPADATALLQGQGALYVFAPESIIVAGGDDIAEVAVSDFRAASSDPLSSVAPGLVSHLSNDQGGSLVLLCRAFGGQPGAMSATLAGIDQYGMDLLVTTAHGRESVRLPFTHPVTTPEEVRRELTVMSRGARFKLGVG